MTAARPTRRLPTPPAGYLDVGMVAARLGTGVQTIRKVVKREYPGWEGIPKPVRYAGRDLWREQEIVAWLAKRLRQLWDS